MYTKLVYYSFLSHGSKLTFSQLSDIDRMASAGFIMLHKNKRYLNYNADVHAHFLVFQQARVHIFNVKKHLNKFMFIQKKKKHSTCPVDTANPQH